MSFFKKTYVFANLILNILFHYSLRYLFIYFFGHIWLHMKSLMESFKMPGFFFFIEKPLLIDNLHNYIIIHK